MVLDLEGYQIGPDFVVFDMGWCNHIDHYYLATPYPRSDRKARRTLPHLCHATLPCIGAKATIPTTWILENPAMNQFDFPPIMLIYAQTMQPPSPRNLSRHKPHYYCNMCFDLGVGYSILYIIILKKRIQSCNMCFDRAVSILFIIILKKELNYTICVST